MKMWVVFSLFVSTSCFAQSSPSGDKQTGKNNILGVFSSNRILVGSNVSQRLNPIKLNDPNTRIRVSGTVIKEVETAVKTLYGIENKLIDLKVVGRKTQFLNLSSHIGAKGWEARATGALSKKRKATFDFNYQFSLENMFLNGNGHRIMLITRF